MNRSRKKWLPKGSACPPTDPEGKFNRRNAPGESHIKRFSDRGSTPLGSTNDSSPRLSRGLLSLVDRANPLAPQARMGVRIFAAEQRPLAMRWQGGKYSPKAKLPSDSPEQANPNSFVTTERFGFVFYFDYSY